MSKRNQKQAKQLLFISHSSADITQAKRIVKELEARGVSCWLAPHEIEFNEDYAERLVSALRSCTATLVLISEKSVGSRHVRREIEIAHEENHTFYPVRLIDIELADQLNYFLKAGRWIDLFHGRDTANYDELAKLVQCDEEISARKKRNQRKISWGVAGALLLSLLVLGGFMMMRLQSLDASISDITGEGRAPDPYEDVHVAIGFQEGNEGYFSSPHSATVWLDDLPGFDGQVDATLYRGSNLERLKPIGIYSGPVEQSDYDANFKLDVLDTPHEVTACLRYTATLPGGVSQQMIIVSRQAPFLLEGKPIIVAKVPTETTCADHLGVGLSADDQVALDLRRILYRAVYQGIKRLVRVAGMPPATGEISMKFDTTGPDTRLPPIVTFYLETGDAPDNLTTSEVVRFRSNNNSSDSMIYNHPVGEYLRVCISTLIANSELSVHDVSLFRKAGGTYIALKNGTGPIINTDSRYCSIAQNGHVITGPDPAVLRFWTDPLPAGSGWNKGDAGKPDIYSWGGFTVGMPFDDALALARSLLPHAYVSEADRSEELYYGDILTGRTVSVVDRMTEQKIGLVADPDGDKVAFFSVRANYPPKSLHWKDFPPKLEKSYGPMDSITAESFETHWPQVRSGCAYTYLSSTGFLGIDIGAPSEIWCPFEVSIKTRIWRNQEKAQFHLILGNLKDLYTKYKQ